MSTSSIRRPAPEMLQPDVDRRRHTRVDPDAVDASAARAIGSHRPPFAGRPLGAHQRRLPRQASHEIHAVGHARPVPCRSQARAARRRRAGRRPCASAIRANACPPLSPTASVRRAGWRRGVQAPREDERRDDPDHHAAAEPGGAAAARSPASRPQGARLASARSGVWRPVDCPWATGLAPSAASPAWTRPRGRAEPKPWPRTARAKPGASA